MPCPWLFSALNRRGFISRSNLFVLWFGGIDLFDDIETKDGDKECGESVEVCTSYNKRYAESQEKKGDDPKEFCRQRRSNEEFLLSFHDSHSFHCSRVGPLTQSTAIVTVIRR